MKLLKKIVYGFLTEQSITENRLLIPKRIKENDTTGKQTKSSR